MLYLAFILYLLIAVSIRKIEGSFLSPAAFLTLFWTFLFGLSLFFAPDYSLSIYANLYILSMICIFFGGGRLAGKFSIKKKIIPFQIIENLFNSKVFYATTISLGLFTGLLSLFILLKTKSIEFGDLFSVGNYVSIASRLSNDRYAGQELDNRMMLFLSVNYTFVLVCGLFFSIFKNKILKFLSFVPLTPSLLLTFLTTSRFIFLIACSLFLSSFLAISLIKVNYTVFSRKNIYAMLTGIIAVPLLFIFTQISRMNLSFGELYELKRVTNHLRIWFFGNLSGFSNWFDNFPFFDQKPSWGQHTFGGIVEVLGHHTRTPGTFNYTFISENFSITNIYTIFRFLIEDFTIWGAFVVIFLSGFVAKISYQILMSNRNLVFAGVLSLFYTIILWSFATSITMYNAIIFAYLVFVLLLLLLHIKLSKISEQS